MRGAIRSRGAPTGISRPVDAHGAALRRRRRRRAGPPARPGRCRRPRRRRAPRPRAPRRSSGRSRPRAAPVEARSGRAAVGPAALDRHGRRRRRVRPCASARLARSCSATGSSAHTTAPSRSTVTRSQPATTSASRCVMITTGRPVVGERAAHGEQRLGLGVDEHGGRLVEDQQPGVGVEGAQDLQALLLADRQPVHRHVVAHRQPVPLAPARRRGAGRGAPRAAAGPRGRASTRFSAAVSVGTSVKCCCTIATPRSRRAAA